MRTCAWTSASAAMAAGLLAVGCGGDRVHVFGAQRYDATHDCLEAGAAVDVIDGPDPGPCNEVHCWISPGADVYVTTTACDAPIGYVDHTHDAPRSACSYALAALARGTKGACP